MCEIVSEFSTVSSDVVLNVKCSTNYVYNIMMSLRMCAKNVMVL